MIITVLWEDQRGAEVKGFGPHDLLLACLADDTGGPRDTLKRLVESHPKKGNGNVRAALQRNLAGLSASGPVFAVIDRDKIRQLWRYPGPPPPDCKPGIAEPFRLDAPGDYDLVFLVDNMESLVAAARNALAVPHPSTKPNPDERDRLLARAAWGARDVRAAIRGSCTSFDRLVARIVRRLNERAGGV